MEGRREPGQSEFKALLDAIQQKTPSSYQTIESALHASYDWCNAKINGNTLLYWAVKHSNNDAARLLLQHHAKHFSKDSIDPLAVHYALFHQHPSLSDLLMGELGVGSDQNTDWCNTIVNEETLLYWAVQRNNDAAVDRLLQQHTQSNQRSAIDLKAFDLAIIAPDAYRSSQMVKSFLKHGVNPNGTATEEPIEGKEELPQQNLRPPMHAAIDAQHFHLIPLLVRAGASPLLAWKKYSVFFRLAEKLRFDEFNVCCNELLKRPEDYRLIGGLKNKQDFSFSRTVTGSLETLIAKCPDKSTKYTDQVLSSIQLLIKLGLKDAPKWFPLHSATYKSWGSDIMFVLLLSELNPECENLDHKTVIDLFPKENPERARWMNTYLEGIAARRDCLDLVLAIQNNNLNQFSQLLSRKAIKYHKQQCLDYFHHEGNTLLHLTVLQDAPDLFALLIKQGADKNALNGQGKTPFQLALDQSKTKIVQYYIQSGLVDCRKLSKEEKSQLAQQFLSIIYANPVSKGEPGEEVKEEAAPSSTRGHWSRLSLLGSVKGPKRAQDASEEEYQLMRFITSFGKLNGAKRLVLDYISNDLEQLHEARTKGTKLYALFDVQKGLFVADEHRGFHAKVAAAKTKADRTGLQGERDATPPSVALPLAYESDEGKEEQPGTPASPSQPDTPSP